MANLRKLDHVLELEEENARLRIALRELIAMVIPATGVGVDNDTARVSREAIMAYLNLTSQDISAEREEV